MVRESTKPQPKPQEDRIPQNRNDAPRRRSGGLDPDNAQAEKGSAIARTKQFLENVFSYRGGFWIGMAIAIAAFVVNLWFYYTLFTIWMGPFIAVPFALAISFGTSYFQLKQKMETATARMTLHQIFVAGSKPSLIPDLDPNVVSDSKNLIADYREAELRNRQYFKMLRLLSFLAEALIGVLFIGNIGAGGSALLSIVGFIFSVAGVEVGVTLALRAGEDELPPQIKEQLEGLLRNDGKSLRLRGL